MSEPDDEPDVVALPIDGTLDLHMFAPREVKPLLADYIDACLKKGITELRIVHGKGKGVLRRIVESALSRHPAVVAFGPGGHGGGGYGATVATLHAEHPTGGGDPRSDR